MTNSLSIAAHVFASRMLMSFSVDETASEIDELVHKFPVLLLACSLNCPAGHMA